MTMGAPGPLWRVPVLVAAMLGLVSGVLAGLARLGWPVAPPSPEAAAQHGALMICGFFGTVIALERAVALSTAWAYGGAAACGLGGLALASGLQESAFVLFAAGSSVLLAGSLVVLWRARAMYAATLALGASCWLAGNLLWAAGLAIGSVVPAWIAFLVLTIAGERLELSRYLPPARGARLAFALLAFALLAGAALHAALAAKAGGLLFAAALLGLAAWLMRHDIARRNLREQGLTRFIAVCLICGYLWLAAGALIALAAGALAPAGFAYDAALHAWLLGFVFSMVFGHAPIIFPAVLAVPVPYTRFAYLPLAALLASLALRVGADLAADPQLRAMGALANAGALALFVLGMAGTVAWGLLRPARSGRGSAILRGSCDEPADGGRGE